MELVTRRLRKKPLFLIAVLGTLTVGLGAFAVVYTAVDKILLEPLPYRNPHDLYMVWRQTENGKKFFVSGGTVCWPNGADVAPETLRSAQDASASAA